jgi:hypothetical protein
LGVENWPMVIFRFFVSVKLMISLVGEPDSFMMIPLRVDISLGSQIWLPGIVSMSLGGDSSEDYTALISTEDLWALSSEISSITP